MSLTIERTMGLSGAIAQRVQRPGQRPHWVRAMKHDLPRGVLKQVEDLRRFVQHVQAKDLPDEIEQLEMALGLSTQLHDIRVADERKVLRTYLDVLVARSIAKITLMPVVDSCLRMRVIRADGRVEDLGIVSRHVVTTAGVNFLVDALQNLVEPELMHFHGLGTGTNAEANGDTALQTELTTQYNPDSTRATGSQTEGASANIYRTVGTNTVDASAAVTEHGILSQAATGGGTLLDRSVFSVINLASADSLQSTYDLTISAGG